MINNILKSVIVAVLAWQVRRLYKKHKFVTIGVVGSYGKTSTKKAIAEVIGHHRNVQYQDGNYNDVVSVPLVFFGLTMPRLRNPFAWLGIFWAIEKKLSKPYPYEVVVLELGTDGPGQIIKFKKYLHLDLAIVTSIGPEHMEYFDDLAAVAREELSVTGFSARTLVNANLCDPEFLVDQKTDQYKVELNKQRPITSWNVIYQNKPWKIAANVLGEAQVYSLSSAYVAGLHLGINPDELSKSLSSVTSVPGRMNILKGKVGSTIIDDTYNASPEATEIALRTLYDYPAKHKIALLGNMNELGAFSAGHHTDIGKLCDPKRVDLVVTLGPDANKFLAAAAENTGCKVYRAKNAQEAGQYIEKLLNKDMVVLAKGSQNGVYAEEAIKHWLAGPVNSSQLVRQSSEWLAKKL